MHIKSYFFEWLNYFLMLNICGKRLDRVRFFEMKEEKENLTDKMKLINSWWTTNYQGNH